MNVDQALLANADLLRQSLDACAYPVWITNLDGIIQYSNHAQQKLCGYSGEELLGSSDRMFLSGPALQLVKLDTKKTLHNGALGRATSLSSAKIANFTGSICASPRWN